MKASLKLMSALLAISIPCYMTSAFKSLGNENQQGKIYEALPKTIKNSGKFVTFYISKNPQPSTIEIIYFYPISGTQQKHGGMKQAVQIAPNQTVKTVHILPPVNPKYASIMINTMPKSTWDLHIQIGQANAIKQPTAAQKALRNKLNKQNMASPVSSLNIKYSKIKQTITLKAPSDKKQTVKLATVKGLSKKPTIDVQKKVQKTDTLWSDIKKDLSEGEQEIEKLVEKL